MAPFYSAPLVYFYSALDNSNRQRRPLTFQKAMKHHRKVPFDTVYSIEKLLFIAAFRNQAIKCLPKNQCSRPPCRKLRKVR